MVMDITIENLISYSEAAKMLGVSRVTVYAMIQRGEIVPVRISGRGYFIKPEIERIAEGRKLAR